MIYDTIKKTVHFFLPDSRILLFGSRARGNNDIHSDYDILIITPDEQTHSEKLTSGSQIDRAIVKAIHAPVDVLLYSESEILQKEQLPGHIVRSAIREGIAL